METMAFSCLGVSGGASGSRFAAAKIALSSAGVGILTIRDLAIFDMVLHLTTSGAAQADDPSHFASINKGNVIQDPGLRYQRDHARFVVIGPAIDPDQRQLPSRA